MASIHIHHDTIDFRKAKLLQHLKTLIAAYDISSALVPGNRFNIAEFLHRAQQFFLFRITRL